MKAKPSSKTKSKNATPKNKKDAVEINDDELGRISGGTARICVADSDGGNDIIVGAGAGAAGHVKVR